MTSKFSQRLRFKGHLLQIDGIVKDGRILLYHVYLFGTDIEISDSLTSSQHDELCEFILKLI